MKTRILIFLFLLAGISGFTQNGYQIKVKLKPFNSGYLYLGHHFGNKQYIIDSAAINANNEATFSGKEKLYGSLNMVILPQKNWRLETLED